MLAQILELSSILASMFWLVNVLLIAFAKGRRFKVIISYLVLFLLALSLYNASGTFAILAGPYLLIGTIGALVLIILAVIPFWCISRVHGMLYALTSSKNVTPRRTPKPTDTRETIDLIHRINQGILGFTLAILVGSVLISALGTFSIPVTLLFVVVLSIVYVWSEVAGHLASDEIRLRTQFTAFTMLTASFSICLVVILFSLLIQRFVPVAAAMMTAIISPVPFVFVGILDRIKDRLFPTGTARRALALNMVALHQRSILFLSVVTIILSDVPAAIVSVSSRDTGTFSLWVVSLLVFITAMIQHFTRSTYSYLLMGDLINEREVEQEIDRAARRAVRFR
jgi:hypothetical protein